MQGTQVSYSPYFNRNRVIYFLHPQPAELAKLIDMFGAEGFLTNIALDLAGLALLVQHKRPDAIITQTVGKSGPDSIAKLRAVALGTRIYALADDLTDVTQAARVMRSGALFVFASPIRSAEVLKQVQSDLSGDVRSDRRGRKAVLGLTSLTTREREVLDLILAGEKNNDIGKTLQISPRTVEVHRGRVMVKLGARNAVELARIALQGQMPTPRGKPPSLRSMGG